MTALIASYMFGLIMLLFLAFMMWVSDEDKWASRVLLAAWIWPLLAAFFVVYLPVRYGRTFISSVFKSAELHELVKVERDQWTGVDDGPVGRERNKLSKIDRRWV